MSSEILARAAEYRKTAESKLKGWGLFSNKFEDAAEYYEKAANNYKLGKGWNEAAECYVSLADCSLKLGSKHDAATALVEASKAANKSGKPAAAPGYLRQAVALYTDLGRLNMAARQLREIAEMAEKADNKLEAIYFYEQAADLFETDNSTSDANKCRLKIAEFAAEAGDYARSVGIFEDAARRAVENNLLKYSARGHLLNAGICYLCFASPNDLEIKFSRFKDMDMNFEGSQEAILLEGCLEAFTNLDGTSVERFSDALARFDRMIRIDAWKTKLLLVAKRRMESMLEGGGNGGDEDEDDELL
mmetsp:Transcript_36413/g.107485  ORF Transcript_36413/g.107485 Transcript_36413/m.107485 type:complete len:304 (-) Transcript_36413:1403-2314(-)